MLVLACAVAGPGAAAPGTPAPASDDRVVSGPLRVLTLNLAHGRKDALNQMLVGRRGVERNLAEVAALLRQARPHVVGLQEADGPSRWSGGFDHVALLARQADYPWQARGSHARTWLFDYGTALLSRVPFTQQLEHTFQPSPPSLSKGLTLGQVAWRPPGMTTTIHVDIVSVHLDFSRASVRKRQIAEMAAILSNRRHPTVVLADMNSDWSDGESIVAALAQRCDMQAYRPAAEGMGTYVSNGRRLDWVLISDELAFLHHAVLPRVVSDHRAVVADIGLKSVPPAERQRTKGASRCTG